MKKKYKYLKKRRKIILKKQKQKQKRNLKRLINSYIVTKYTFICLAIAFIVILFFIMKNMKSRKKLLQKILDFERSRENLTELTFKEFRKFNSENKLFENTYYKKSEKPDISIVITMRNQAHCIHKCIRSIQNQSIKNLEMIIVDDCSQDNTTELIEQFQKEDERIIYLKHDTNEGKIKSRTDGVKIAKGKYITIIDGDDAFIHKDILYDSLQILKIGNLDVVEFKLSYYRGGKFRTVVNTYDILNISGIIYQPELRTKFFITKGPYSLRGIQNRNVCSKIIKNEIFQQAIKNIGEKYTNEYMLNYEDTIMIVAVFQVAKSII
jgi:teichuronic acid biosynthesis glycosyltransferase TuaG